MNNLTEVCFVGIGVGENYVWCLFISMGLGKAKRCVGGLKLSL